MSVENHLFVNRLKKSSAPADENVVSVSEHFGRFVVQGADIRVEINDDGHVVVYSHGQVECHKPTKFLNAGDVMPEWAKSAGWVYGGLSVHSGEPFYIEPKDAGVMSWYKAIEHVDRIGARFPTLLELDHMFAARTMGALAGTFNENSNDLASWYWAHGEMNGLVPARPFGAGIHPQMFSRQSQLSLRCIRR